MSHRLRPRYGRISAFLTSLGVTAFALLCGLGVFGTATVGGAAYANPPKSVHTLQAMVGTPRPDPVHAHLGAAAALVRTGPGARSDTSVPAADQDLAVPADSGAGRRVVFDMSAQRVWLVDDADAVERTYLVSGSVTDNLDPGSYSVYSRSRWAVGVDDSGVMEYFVRFTRGDNAAIGFHDIPTLNGTPLQTEAQLGTPQSHGCIRQARQDAVQLWDFAPVGTQVDVVA
jgi:hypothetical protein